MKITHKIRKAKKYLVDIESKKRFVIGAIVNKEKLVTKFNKIGDKSYVPKLENGINSQRNIIGEFKPDKTQPKEVRYRAQEWHLTDWGGHEHDGIAYIPYERYPRFFIEPLGVQFNLTELATGQSIIAANNVFENYQLSSNNLLMIAFIINLLVETLDEAEIYQLDELTGLPIRKVKTVNWKILPPGERVWNFVKNGIGHVSKSEQKMIENRFMFLESYYPAEIYKGEGSYTGYVVFYYKKLGIYIFDSIMYGQATYVFDGNWQEVSHLTKKQIIENNIAKKRIIHGPSWSKKIAAILE